MSPLRIFTLRLILYGGILSYLLADLFLFHGPFAKVMEAGNPFSAKSRLIARSNRVIATISTQPITQGQLDRAVKERLWLSGTKASRTSTDHKQLRDEALNDLIDHELLRTRSMASGTKVSNEELETRLQRFQARFESEGEMLEAMKSQGIPHMDALRARLAADIQQETYLTLQIGPLTQVSDTEARAWYDKHRDALAIPEQIQVRHVFLPSLEHSDADAQQILGKALASLRSSSKDFASIARDISEDPNSKDNGGSIGWVSRHRLPDDFAKVLFDLPLNKITIIQTKIGWHLAEVTGRKAAEVKSYESAKPEIIAALEVVKRHKAIQQFRETLRESEAKHITIFHEKIE